MGPRVGTYAGYPIHISDRWPKKYYAEVGGRKVHFGDVRYQQYHDKMGRYSHLDHLNPARRASYKTRHHKDRLARGTPGWFADQILW